ncbi:MAG: response regulator [Candidatus Brocadiales bacterium]|nr:response regulator [Candidatus Brocadiales bacterium]
MQDNQIKILLIEDDPGDVRLIQEMLKESGAVRYELSHADCLSSGMEFLKKNEYDVLLLDLGLPESQGLSTLNKILSLSLKLPIVILTSHTDEMPGIVAVQKGIQDYLVKGRLDSNLLVHSIRYAIERKKLENELVSSNGFLEQRVQERTSALEMVNKMLQLKIEELLATEDKLKENEEKLRLLIESSQDGILAYDRDIRYTLWNKAMERISGMKREDVLGKSPFDVFPFLDKIGEGEAFRNAVKGEVTKSSAMPYNIPQRGRRGYFESAHFPLYDIHGAIAGGMAIIRDVTEGRGMEEEQNKLREQLYHVQKLESIGTLAGGVAHDFNNILAIIIGYGNMLEKNIGKDNPSWFYVQKILKSAERATNLVQGLLAFSRKQGSSQKPVVINKILIQVKNLLSRLIGEDIVLDVVLTDKESIVMADNGQMEQVLMNLATNARDAMPNGGKLTIYSDVVVLDNEFIKNNGYGKIGTYVLISVSDTGMGIDKNIQRKIFEPFFTTKEIGKGTGLGLSIVYGIIKQHNGYICVDSEHGKGATFRIYLPVITKSTAEEGKPSPLPAYLKGTELILVAEDEAEVRSLARLLLEEAGYKVIEATDGCDTINKFMENKEDVSLLLLDVIMPVKNGREAYEEIRKIRPDIKVLFMSGYSKGVIDKKSFPKEGLHFVSKPFSQTTLLKRVREILDNSIISI